MEESNYINDDDNEDEDSYLFKKILDTLLTFNSHFVEYIREMDPDLCAKAIDYAKTFTEEDIPDIILDYIDEEEDKDEQKEI